MFKDFARSGLNTLRSARSRLAYRSRISETPDIGIGAEKDVLIITVDCLRNDRISRTGYRRETTPFLDTLPSYTSAIAPAPWTFSSVPSILTGLYPSRHGAAYPDDSSRNQDLGNPPNGIRDEVYTMSELFAANGYETKCFTAIGTAAIPLKGRFKNIQRSHDASAGKLLSDVMEWWTSTDGVKLGYVQLGDLHEPLHPPEDLPFGDIPDIDGIDRWRFEQGNRESEAFEEYRQARELLYDTLVRYVDGQIDRIMGEIADDAVVIVTSDHGEEFWEFADFEEDNFDDPRGVNGVGHGHALVPPVLEVPILSNLGSVTDVDEHRSLVDIVPTVFEQMEVDDSTEFDGIPLQSQEEPRPVLSQEIAYGPNQMSVTKNGRHLIYVPETDRSILMDFESGELLDDQDTIDQLSEHLPSDRVAGEQVELSQEVEQQLSDLGYAE